MSDLDLEVMLAKNYDRRRVESWKETYAEPKLDGVRVIVFAKKDKAVKYYTRNGRELGMFTHLDKSVKMLCDRLRKTEPDMRSGIVLDTEAVGVTFGDVSGAIHTKGTVALTCRLHVFHSMPMACFTYGHDNTTQLVRLRNMQTVLDSPIKGITTAKPVRVLDHNQVMKAHAFYRSEGMEGTMVKNLHVAWVAKRTWAWMKVKNEITLDVMVTGIKEGTGKYVGMCGALICDHNGRKIRVSGMSDELRASFFSKPKSIVGKMIEVEAQEETDAGSLRHPRFKRVRDDKQ